MLEDVLNPATRPKFEAQENHALIILKSIRFDNENRQIILEQLSFILGPNYVLSFLERPGHYFDSVRDRLRNSKGRIRNQGADYLCYALIDAVVDDYYKLPEALSETIEVIEAKVLSKAETEDLEAIYNLKREIVLLDRAIWPVLELVNGMRKGESELISENLGPFLQDLSDHAQQLISSTQAIREIAANLQDLYMSTISNSMNQVMKVLAIVATIFIPLTFIAEIFGMNFEFMPELKARYGYFITLGIMLVVTVGGRILGLVWMFVGIVAISTFIAAVTSALTVNQLASPIRGPEDLPAVRVAAVQDSTAQSYLRKRGVGHRAYKSPLEALRALARGGVDAVVYDEPILRYLILTELQGSLSVLSNIFEEQNTVSRFPPGVSCESRSIGFCSRKRTHRHGKSFSFATWARRSEIDAAGYEKPRNTCCTHAGYFCKRGSWRLSVR